MDISGIWQAFSSEGVYLIPENENARSWPSLDAKNTKNVSLLIDNDGYIHGVLFQGNNAYSLFREKAKEEAEKAFEIIAAKLSLILDLEDTSVINVDILNSLRNALLKHPSWSPAHIVVRCNFLEAFENEDLLFYIDSQKCDDGQTPLHLAVKYHGTDVVRKLVDYGANVFIEDDNGETVVHHIISNYKNQQEEDLMLAILSSSLEDEAYYEDIMEAISPLVLAVKTGKHDAARVLIESDKFVTLPDDEARPIHHALKQDNLLLASEILAKHRGQGFARCKKYNATALHWARSKDVLETILNCDFELNVRSNTGHTALHVMVKKERFECLVELLASGADPEIPDNDGNSPFIPHLNFVDAIRALVVFNANVNAKNKEGLTPRHYAAAHEGKGGLALQAIHSVGATRCDKQYADCHKGCIPWGRYDGEELAHPYDPQEECDITFKHTMDEVVNNLLETCKKYKDLNDNEVERAVKYDKLLCLDGGGSRGCIEIQLLAAIERASDKRILDSFDWIAGTSAGSINAGMICQGFCMTDFRKNFFKSTGKLFEGTKPYSGENLEGLLSGMFGDQKITDIKKVKLMITSALSNRAPPALHIFRSYPPPSTSSSHIVCYSGNFHNPPCPPHEQTLVNAIRSSTAAPTYFPPKHSFMDGGLLANNPTTDAMTEISEYYADNKRKGEPVRKLGLVVSLGTGNGPVPEMKEIAVFVPNSVTDIFKVGEQLKAASHLGQIMLSLLTDAQFRPNDRARAWCTDIGAAYFRLTPSLSQMTDLDETDISVLMKLMWETQVYVTKNREKIDQIGELINLL